MTMISDVRTLRKLTDALKVTPDRLVPDESSEEDAPRSSAKRRNPFCKNLTNDGLLYLVLPCRRAQQGRHSVTARHLRRPVSSKHCRVASNRHPAGFSSGRVVGAGAASNLSSRRTAEDWPGWQTETLSIQVLPALINDAKLRAQ